MAFQAKEVMLRAQYVLQDAGAVRWTAPELRLWLNDGLREIAIRKPNATSASVEIALAKGTYQKLPAGYQALVRITRNLDTLDDSVDKRGGGRAITKIHREVMDAQIPGWQDSSVLPYSKQVMHYIEEIIDRRSYYVVPGNDGTGTVEAIVSRVPAEIPEPATAILDVDSYDTVVEIADEYRNSLVDYSLYRAFSKDMNIAGGAQRSQMHYQQFADALGIKVQMEDMTRQAARMEQ
jgi:hypothetical protein